MELNIVYALNPKISFIGKTFCLTGMFKDHERTDLERYIEHKGGNFTATINEKTDYLVIGSQGTRCCSFSCCTRVVEHAIRLKESGASLLFVAESDFLASLIP